MSDHVLRAYLLDGQGGASALPSDHISKADRADGLVWIHLDGNDTAATRCLEDEISSLDPFIIGALLDEESRPRMTQIGHGALLVLRGVNLNENEDPEDMVSICLWVEETRIVMVSRTRIRAAGDIEARLLAGGGPRDTGHFLSMLCERLFARMEPILTALDDRADDIEEQVLEQSNPDLRGAITDVRIQAIMFRRYMAPQREAIDHLRMADFEWLNNTHRRHLQEVYNHLTRYVEDLDAIRERAQIVKDEIAHVQADRLNKHMYILSMIAAIFMPLGFLTGLLGINVAGIPGAEFGYAFWIFVGMLSLIVALQLLLFKWLKWF
ncbi:zinc transporter [Cohaesibacter marisflavi]|uniref:Zinc transporter n=1 Tax=Cohaesibacter marisflavi TaxID=655353 RepID=A0A1I5FZX1_9HYPH|nr:zinc transporter ZntB [Cohaesibacter marisflavi]SFO29324.1 zinc transporter [Cohaesibacter marisflavi]